ncbi:MAG: peptidylprolyl isomerase [Epsilonproteobacteria bacterium]|nr:peptidylprolyl isomerase [Campylobacterota bacterium]
MNNIFKTLFMMLLPTLGLFSSDIVATVNEKNITKQDINEFVSKSIPGARYSFMNAEQKKQVLDQLVVKALYVDVAKKEGIEQDAEYMKALQKAKENLMLDVWMKKRLETIAVSEVEKLSYYNNNSSKFMQAAAASVHHILVTTESEAKEIIKELQRSSDLKAKFIELAHSKSTGPSSKNGGDLGWFNEDQMVTEFSKAALALERGQITMVPVKTHFGYHVIYLTDKRPAGKVEYAKVKDNISKSIKLEKFKQNLESLSQKLKNSAKITVK